MADAMGAPCVLHSGEPDPLNQRVRGSSPWRRTYLDRRRPAGSLIKRILLVGVDLVWVRPGRGYGLMVRSPSSSSGGAVAAAAWRGSTACGAGRTSCARPAGRARRWLPLLGGPGRAARWCRFGGEHDAGVAEHGLHGLELVTGGQGQAGRAVSQVVQPDRW